MIKVHVAADGTKSFQVYERARVRERSIKVYVGSFASRRQAEFAAQQHRVTQRGIKAGELPAAVDHKRTMGDALDAWLRAIKDQRSHDEYESRMRLYVRPTFDRTPLVKITKPKLIDLRNSLKEREEPSATRRSTRSSPRWPRPTATSSNSAGAPSARSSGSSPPAKCRSC